MPRSEDSSWRQQLEAQVLGPGPDPALGRCRVTLPIGCCTMMVVVLGWMATLRLHFTSLDSGSKADLTRKSNLGQRQVCVIPLCDGQPPPKLPSTHSPTAKCPPFIWYFTFLYYRVSHNFGPTFVFCHFLGFWTTYRGTSDLYSTALEFC